MFHSIHLPKNLADGETSHTLPLCIRMEKCREYIKVKNENGEGHASIEQCLNDLEAEEGIKL